MQVLTKNQKKNKTHSDILSAITTHISRLQGRKWANALQGMCQERFTVCVSGLCHAIPLMGLWQNWRDVTEGLPA